MDEKAKKISASEQVFEALQSQISSGVWKVGDRLPSEGELAERYGVNRLTVRVALQKLNALGVVETRTGSGTYVIEFDFEGYLRMASRFYGQSGMMKNVTEFRNHMEIECARLAWERGTDEELAELGRRGPPRLDGYGGRGARRLVPPRGGCGPGLPRAGGAHVPQPALRLFLRRGAGADLRVHAVLCEQMGAGDGEELPPGPPPGYTLQHL